MTGFARLLIFLIFVLPLAFFGASYINGEDPIQKIKDFTGMNEGANKVAVSKNNPDNSANALDQDTEKRILKLERDLAIAREELARCQTKGVE